MDTLNRLLVQSGQGDAQAFQQLYQLSSGRLFAVCQRVLNNPSVAEEVLQESYIKIWHAAQQFNSSQAQAMTWMSAIARHQAIDRLRSEQRRPTLLSDSETDYETLDFRDLTLSPEALKELSEEAQHLSVCLERLNKEQRHCLLAAYYEGKTHAELSKELGKPLGTVKAWIRRGLAQLRECLR